MRSCKLAASAPGNYPTAGRVSGLGVVLDSGEPSYLVIQALGTHGGDM